MHKLIPELNMTKITLWENKKMIIENYQKLWDINDKGIKIDNYFIKGNFLKIEELDQFKVKIYGEIKEIIIEQKIS